MADNDNDGTVTEGEGEGDSGAGGDSNTTFTQEQVNKMLAQNKRETRDKLEKTLVELKELQAKTKTTAEERATLANKIEELNNQLLTKDELVKKERDRLEKKTEEEVKKVAAERDRWQDLFKRSTIETAVISAAAQANAFNPKQILAVLTPSAKLDEITEDGEGTGQFKVVVDFLTTDKDGNQKQLTLTPAEAVKEMTESSEYFNLFKDPATGGLGQNNGKVPGGKKMDAARLAKEDPARFVKLRREGKINLITGEVDLS